MSIEKLKQITVLRKKSHTSFLEKGSQVYKAFVDMEKAAFSDRVLPKKEMEKQ